MNKDDVVPAIIAVCITAVVITTAYLLSQADARSMHCVEKAKDREMASICYGLSRR